MSLCLIFTLVLGNYNGYIALWKNDARKPDQVFPCPVAVLPPADQEALNRGIRIESAQDLQRLLEDYLS